jgi:hypothetical protein
MLVTGLEVSSLTFTNFSFMFPALASCQLSKGTSLKGRIAIARVLISIIRLGDCQPLLFNPKAFSFPRNSKQKHPYFFSIWTKTLLGQTLTYKYFTITSIPKLIFDTDRKIVMIKGELNPNPPCASLEEIEMNPSPRTQHKYVETKR